jgi:hypothetical protein
MTQTLYAHMNIIKKEKKVVLQISIKITFQEQTMYILVKLQKQNSKRNS